MYTYSCIISVCVTLLMPAAVLPAEEIVKPKDTIFVLQQGATGAYISAQGTIVALERTHLIMVSLDGTERLYTPDAVRHVTLDTTSRQEDTEQAEQWKRLINTYWNRDVPLIVLVVQSFPVIGAGLKFLDRISPAAGSFISFLLLIAALFWAGYRLRDLLVVTRETQRLNRLKLHLDVAKVRYEALALSGPAPEEERLALSAIQLPLLKVFQPSKVVPDTITPSRVSRAFKWLTGFVLPELERRERREIYQAEWRIRLRNGYAHAAMVYRRKMRSSRLGEILLWLYGSTAFWSPMMFFVAFAEENYAFGITVFLMYLVPGGICLYYALRMHALLYEVRMAYQEALSVHSVSQSSRSDEGRIVTQA